MPMSAMRRLDSRSHVPLQLVSPVGRSLGSVSAGRSIGSLSAGTEAPEAAAAATAAAAPAQTVLGPGDCFAEVAYFTEVPKAEAVRSLTVCRVLVIPRRWVRLCCAAAQAAVEEANVTRSCAPVAACVAARAITTKHAAVMPHTPLLPLRPPPLTPRTARTTLSRETSPSAHGRCWKTSRPRRHRWVGGQGHVYVCVGGGGVDVLPVLRCGSILCRFCCSLCPCVLLPHGTCTTSHSWWLSSCHATWLLSC
jgi:hypothetical protein